MTGLSKLVKSALTTEVAEAVVATEGEGGVDIEGEGQTFGEDDLPEGMQSLCKKYRKSKNRARCSATNVLGQILLPYVRPLLEIAAGKNDGYGLL